MFRLPNPRVLPGCGAAAALLALTLAAPAARSQGAYPERPLTVVVPFSAGGATDVAARLLAKEMAATLGQAIVVENKAGAAGAIGAAFVARAAPDGYTVCFCGGGPLVILKLLDARLPYDPLRDFAPVTLSHQVDYVLAVSTASPIRSVRDLVAAAKASPGKLAYASTGNGGPAHLGQEYFNRLAGVDITHVPYKGESQILPDLVNGPLALGIFSAQLGEQMQQAGKVRLIGTWSGQRLARLPKLPTVAEQGYPSFSAGTFIGIMAPRGTPGPVIDKLNAVYVKALNEPGLRKQLLEMGLTPVGSSPAATAAFLHREEVKWSQVIDSLGMRGRN